MIGVDGCFEAGQISDVEGVVELFDLLGAESLDLDQHKYTVGQGAAEIVKEIKGATLADLHEIFGDGFSDAVEFLDGAFVEGVLNGGGVAFNGTRGAFKGACAEGVAAGDFDQSGCIGQERGEGAVVQGGFIPR